MTDHTNDLVSAAAPQAVRSGFGSIADAMEGRYDFSIIGVLDEARQKISGNKGLIWIAAIMFMITMAIFSMLSQFIYQHIGIDYVSGHVTPAAAVGIVVKEFISLFISTPLGAGYVMIGVKLASNAPTQWQELFNYFDKTLVLVSTALLMYLMIAIGLLLFIVPGIYLAFAYSLAIPLVVEKGLGPWEALETSRKAITHHWFKLFGLYMLFGLLMLISMLALFVGLIWTVPMGALLTGIVYRIIFGYEGQPEANDSSSQSQEFS